ncbi:MAG: hypothetical protein ACSHW0_02150 [Thalassotalea sp.]
MANVEKTAEQLFICKSSYQAISAAHEQRAVTFNDMVKSLQGFANIDKAWLMQQINQNLAYRRAYQLLLKQLTFSYSPKQAAASTFEEFPKRANDYFSISFKRDKTFHHQVYVLLSINHPLSRHISDNLELHICNDDNVNVLSFPPLSQGRTQTLLETEDKVFKSLLNNNSELYLT